MFSLTITRGGYEEQKVRKVLAAAILIACVSEGPGHAGDASPPQRSRTMASLFAEGYEMQRVRVFKETIWLRKPNGETAAYICDRGGLGSATFESYRAGNYDQVMCSLAP
jgi:hypothetical protein